MKISSAGLYLDFSLQRTVFDALTTLLCDDFCVGVQVQGKKLRDDSKSLVEAGICHGGMLQNLSFTLEPKRNRVATPSFLPLPDGSGSDPPPTRCLEHLSLSLYPCFSHPVTPSLILSLALCLFFLPICPLIF